MVPFLISYHIYPGPATCPYCKQPHAGESERLTYYSLAKYLHLPQLSITDAFATNHECLHHSIYVYTAYSDCLNMVE